MLVAQGADFDGFASGSGNGLGNGGFFQVLHDYLTRRFNTDYSGANAVREQYAVGGSVDVVTASDQAFPPNILGEPGGSIYDRAALGDPDALAALKDEINFDFGGSSKALDDFKKDIGEIGAEAEDKFEDNAESFKSVTSGGVVQPPTPASPLPTLGQRANPEDLSGFRPEQDPDTGGPVDINPFSPQPADEGTDISSKVIDAVSVPDDD